MSNRGAIQYISLLSALFCLFASSGFSQTATLKNADFETYIASSDSFAEWSFEKDSTGSQKYVISQETDSAHSGIGSLKMEIIDTSDTAVECRIIGSVSNLPPKKVFTVTAWVKYSGMPTYWNGMFHMQQATLKAPDWEWVDGKWGSMWGNDPGTIPWTQVSMSDTSGDSSNVFNLHISLAKGGTLWVDDIEITYTDPVPVMQRAVQSDRWGSILNSRITFSRVMPYSLEAYSINGKALLRESGIAATVDLNRTDTGRGAYLFRVKTAEQIFISRAVFVK